MALSLVLKPYLDPRTSQYLPPFPEEYADYFPTDGHPSLIEQNQDTTTEHVPEEERIWLVQYDIHMWTCAITLPSIQNPILTDWNSNP